MKVRDIFEGPQDYYGLVVSAERANGKFEDVELVDFATDNILSHRPSHAKNMFDHIIYVLRQTGGWAHLEQFLKQNSRQRAELGAEWADDENFYNMKYGPYTADELGWLGDNLADELGHKENDRDAW